MSHMHQHPELGPTPGPSIAEMEEGLRRWAAARPGTMEVETVGRTPKGLPVLLCRISDASVSDEDKQVALLTSTHSGVERVTTAGLLQLIKWLIGGDALAEEIRRRQIVLIMPACEPESYDRELIDVAEFFAGRSRWVYEGWSWDGPLDPENQPEAMAVKDVVDRYQPEVHQDVHGIWFEQSTMTESTGISWASNLYRGYWRAIPELMNLAAEDAGYLTTRGEESAGQMLSTIPVEGRERWFYGSTSTPKVVCGLYSYIQYHSIIQTMEVGWEESAVLRLRRLLQVGNEVWRGEPYPGYPANQVSCRSSVAIAAWGKTAAQRRASRVELWRKLAQFSHTCGWPEARDGVVAFVSTTPESRNLYAPGGESSAPNLNEPNLEPMFAKLKQNPRFNGDALEEYLGLTVSRQVTWPQAEYEGPAEPIQNGLAIRLRLPHPDVTFKHLRLDGHIMEPSDVDGYFVYHNPGTIVQVNIPPGKVEDFHVVTVAFDSAAERTSGFHSRDWELDE